MTKGIEDGMGDANPICSHCSKRILSAYQKCSNDSSCWPIGSVPCAAVPEASTEGISMTTSEAPEPRPAKPIYGNSECALCSTKLYGKNAFAIPRTGTTPGEMIVCETCAFPPIAPTLAPEGQRADIHELKIWPEFFDAIIEGRKFYEIRKNDRGFKVGDFIKLKEFDPTRHGYSGRSTTVEVAYMTIGGTWGLPVDMCVMSIVKLGQAGSTARQFPVANTLSPQDELRCPNCRGTQDQCADNEYCHTLWFSSMKLVAPKESDSKEEQEPTPAQLVELSKQAAAECEGQPIRPWREFIAELQEESKVEEQDGVQEPSVEEIRAASGDHMEVPEGERGNFHIHGGKLYILESIAAQAVMRGEERLIAAETRTAKSVDSLSPKSWTWYIEALTKSYPENPTAIAVAKEVYSMFTNVKRKSDSLSPSEPIREKMLIAALEAVVNERDSELDMMRCTYRQDSPESVAWQHGVEAMWGRLKVIKQPAMDALKLAKGSPSEEGTGQ